MHRDKHHRRITETGTKDKTPVIGMLERGGEVRVTVFPLAARKFSKRKFSAISNRVATSTPMRSCPIKDWEHRDSLTKSSTMPKSMLTGRFTQTEWKTSGACSSAD